MDTNCRVSNDFTLIVYDHPLNDTSGYEISDLYREYYVETTGTMPRYRASALKRMGYCVRR